MNIYEIIILSVALALDALIVSFSYGTIINTQRLKNALLLSTSFGIFQMLMPILGWFLTGVIYIYLQKYSKWIVFTVFFILGIKFIKEAISTQEKDQIKCISFLCILSLALATSIDALGAGISIKFSDVLIWFPSIIIGIITFILSLCGFFIASILKNISEKYVSIFGALILFYLALKSVI